MEFLKRNALRIVNILIVVLVVLILFFEIGAASGISMQPTMSDKNITVNIKIIPHLIKPKRFNIILTNALDDLEGKTYGKRIIALPGETVEIRNQILYINGEPMEQPFLDTQFVKDFIAEYGGFETNFEPITLADDEYFIMGDNRPLSYDSRSFGPIKEKHIRSILLLSIPF